MINNATPGSNSNSVDQISAFCIIFLHTAGAGRLKRLLYQNVYPPA
jgi:hypothetical protein